MISGWDLAVVVEARNGGISLLLQMPTSLSDSVYVRVCSVGIQENSLDVSGFVTGQCEGFDAGGRGSVCLLELSGECPGGRRRTSAKASVGQRMEDTLKRELQPAALIQVNTSPFWHIGGRWLAVF